jgi:hypothetical protein
MFIRMEEKKMEDRNRMKILIAYDGSEGAESAIDDLKRAGLPRRAGAVALTIVEEMIPMSASIGGVDTTFAESLLEEEKDSLALARRARSRIHQLFPFFFQFLRQPFIPRDHSVIDLSSFPSKRLSERRFNRFVQFSGRYSIAPV